MTGSDRRLTCRFMSKLDREALLSAEDMSVISSHMCNGMVVVETVVPPQAGPDEPFTLDPAPPAGTALYQYEAVLYRGYVVFRYGTRYLEILSLADDYDPEVCRLLLARVRDRLGPKRGHVLWVVPESDHRRHLLLRELGITAVSVSRDHFVHPASEDGYEFRVLPTALPSIPRADAEARP